MSRKHHPLHNGITGQIQPSEIRTGGLSGKVGSFGWTRKNPDGSPKMHKGVDLLAEEGAAVYAAHHGRVRRCGPENPADLKQGYGERIYLTANLEDLETRYAHLSEHLVHVGDLVHAGQLIGKVGRSGNVADGVPTHLHFEVWANDEPVDPVLWLVEEEKIA